jgi:hypothetical protein
MKMARLECEEIQVLIEAAYKERQATLEVLSDRSLTEEQRTAYAVRVAQLRAAEKRLESALKDPEEI